MLEKVSEVEAYCAGQPRFPSMLLSTQPWFNLGINSGFWETAHPPLPRNQHKCLLLTQGKMLASGGVGGQFFRNLNIDPPGGVFSCCSNKSDTPPPQSSSFACYRSLFTMEHEKLPGNDKIRASCQANVSPAIYQMRLQTEF